MAISWWWPSRSPNKSGNRDRKTAPVREMEPPNIPCPTAICLTYLAACHQVDGCLHYLLIKPFRHKPLHAFQCETTWNKSHWKKKHHENVIIQLYRFCRVFSWSWPTSRLAHQMQTHFPRLATWRGEAAFGDKRHVSSSSCKNFHRVNPWGFLKGTKSGKLTSWGW